MIHHAWIWGLSLVSGTTEFVFSFQTHSSSLGVALKFKNYILSPKDLTPCEHGWWKVNEIMWVVVHECNDDDEAGAQIDLQDLGLADTAAAMWVTLQSSAFLREVWRWCFAAAPAVLSCLSAQPTAASTSANVRAMLPLDDTGTCYTLLSIHCRYKVLLRVYFTFILLTQIPCFVLFCSFTSSVSWGSLPVCYRVVRGKGTALWWPGWLSGRERRGFLLYVMIVWMSDIV